MQNKWDKTYSQDKTDLVKASDVLIQNQHLLPNSGVAVDLACGLGGNASLLARSGLNTQAWDISSVALAKLNQYADENKLSIETQQRDIETWPPEVNAFDVVVLTHFLHRPTFPALIASLKSGGVMFYQTFIQDKASPIGPSKLD